jgi:hypothetical protein
METSSLYSVQQLNGFVETFNDDVYVICLPDFPVPSRDATKNKLSVAGNIGWGRENCLPFLQCKKCDVEHMLFLKDSYSMFS